MKCILKKMRGVRDGVSSATCCECNLKHFLQEVYWFHRVRLRRDLRPCYTPIYPRSRCKFLQLIRHVWLKHGWSWGWHQVRNTGRRKVVDFDDLTPLIFAFTNFQLKSSKAEPSFFSRYESHIPHQISTSHTFEEAFFNKTSDFLFNVKILFFPPTYCLGQKNPIPKTSWKSPRLLWFLHGWFQ